MSEVLPTRDPGTVRSAVPGTPIPPWGESRDPGRSDRPFRGPQSRPGANLGTRGRSDRPFRGPGTPQAVSEVLPTRDPGTVRSAVPGTPIPPWGESRDPGTVRSAVPGTPIPPRGESRDPGTVRSAVPGTRNPSSSTWQFRYELLPERQIDCYPVHTQGVNRRPHPARRAFRYPAPAGPKPGRARRPPTQITRTGGGKPSGGRKHETNAQSAPRMRG